MSTPVNLINCRSSLLLTQQKLSKNVESRTKTAKRIYFLRLDNLITAGITNANSMKKINTPGILFPKLLHESI
jgi:hypothetical protein